MKAASQETSQRRQLWLRLVGLLGTFPIVVTLACGGSEQPTPTATALPVGQDSDPPTQTDGDYGARSAALVRRLDGVEEALRPLLNEATFDPSTAQTTSWQDQVREQIGVVREVASEWEGLQPPSDKGLYHEEMAAYLDITLRQYELLFEGFVEGDGAKVARGSQLRDQGRAKLADVHAALGTPIAPRGGEAEYRAEARPLTREVTAIEAELFRLTNLFIDDPTIPESAAWRSEMSLYLDQLQQMADDWAQLEPPTRWQEYHRAHHDYIQLDIEAYTLVYESLVELDDRKLLQAEAKFTALQQKRDEIGNMALELLGP